MTWLVTGGAGYIGGHITAAMTAAGEQVVVLDDLSTGDAARIPGTVAHDVAREAGVSGDTVTIRTAGGVTSASAATRRTGDDTLLTWSAVGRKVVTYQGSFLMEPLAHQPFEEIARCLAVTASAA